MDSVVVGLSTINVDRFGPCPCDNQLQLGAPSGGPWGCIERTPIPDRQPLMGGDEVGQGYPDPFWNFSGYMLYDGPALVFYNRFVNFVVKYHDNTTMPYLTHDVQAFLTDYEATHVTPHGNQPFVYECFAMGAQDQLLEGRPTSLISPGSMATLEFSALWPDPNSIGPQRSVAAT